MILENAHLTSHSADPVLSSVSSNSAHCWAESTSLIPSLTCSSYVQHVIFKGSLEQVAFLKTNQGKSHLPMLYMSLAQRNTPQFYAPIQATTKAPSAESSLWCFQKFAKARAPQASQRVSEQDLPTSESVASETGDFLLEIHPFWRGSYGDNFPWDVCTWNFLPKFVEK